MNTDEMRALANRPGAPIESTSEFRAALFDAAEEIDRLRGVGLARNRADGLVNSAVITRAREFAMAAHESIDQRRKYTGEPYIHHPAAVANIVAAVTSREEVIAAAWLHDVVEDTPATLADILEEFGEDVAELVSMVTDVSKPSDGNRQNRKRLDREHLAAASPAAKTIKLADLIDNARSIVAHDPKFARVYLAEEELLLDVLKDGDGTLYRLARDVLRDSWRKLEAVTAAE